MMDNNVVEKKSSNIGYLIIIFLLLCVICFGGGYFLGQKNNESDKNSQVKDNNTNEKTDEKKEDTKEVELVFDASKIKNKVVDDEYPYTYTLSEEKEFGIFKITKIDGGYSIDSDTYELDEPFIVKGDFEYVKEFAIYTGGPGVDSSHVIFVDKEGKLSFIYATYENNKEKLVLKSVDKYKDIVKVYHVELHNESPRSPGGESVVIQTKDGSLYDIYNDFIGLES